MNDSKSPIIRPSLPIPNRLRTLFQKHTKIKVSHSWKYQYCKMQLEYDAHQTLTIHLMNLRNIRDTSSVLSASNLQKIDMQFSSEYPLFFSTICGVVCSDGIVTGTEKIVINLDS